jgi:hypothetical protein
VDSDWWIDGRGEIAGHFCLVGGLFIEGAILSERSESKGPYTAHPLSPDTFFDGAASAARTRWTIFS